MLSQLNLHRSWKSVIQHWKCQVWLKYIHSSDLSVVGNSYEGTKSFLNKSSCAGNLKHAFAQINQNYKDPHKPSHMMATFSTELHVDYQPVTMKQQFCSHTDRHFLLQVWSLQNLTCQPSVLSCVRLFHSCSKDQSSAKEVLTDVGSNKKAMTVKTLSENVVAGHISGKFAAQKSGPSPDFLKMLAKLLYCSVYDMRNLVEKYDFFLHLSPELITTKVNIMLQFGLPSSFVSKNPRLLYQTSADELHKRLQMFKDHSFLKENSVVRLDNLPHYLECRNDYFLKIFKKLCTEKDSLEGCFDQLAYIQFRLKCSKEIAQQLSSTFPLNRGISNTRLKKILDFLLIEAQLGPRFVINHRKLMVFSVERLRARWIMFLSLNIKSESTLLYIFSLNQKEFDNKYGISQDLQK